MNNTNCKIVVDEHIKKYGCIDVLVNNASKQMQCESFEDIDLGISIQFGMTFIAAPDSL